MSDNAATAAPQKRCFVVMGFGTKTDYATGRKLDLDKSYRLLIQPVVKEKGLVCVRADEIRHSGAIDVPMYRELLTADVVIADISTANMNAVYELGIRHALRPRTTIVMSENKLPYPFDLNHISITSYTHLGDAIDFDEVMSFRDKLGKLLDAVLQKEDTDSPVYTFVHGLNPPKLGEEIERSAAAGMMAAVAPMAEPQAPAAGPNDRTLSEIVRAGEDALRRDDFKTARDCFQLAINLGKVGEGPHTPDPYLQQRLVLATYKSKDPDDVTALKTAMGLLKELDLAASNDPETVGLGGAIEKRLFEKGGGIEHLTRAIAYYGRGYYLRDDWYNGINLAFLLNMRTDTPLDATDHEKIADLISANRLRRDVLALCEKDLAAMRERESRTNADTALGKEQLARDREQKFWCLATKAEAHFGLGETQAYEEARAAAKQIETAAWMTETLDRQVKRLKELLDKHGHLIA